MSAETNPDSGEAGHHEARMVHVGDKDITKRRAIAEAVLECAPETARLVANAALPKGDALAAARIAGVMATKRTPDLVPLCHPISVTAAEVDLVVDEASVRIVATVECMDRTGAEMEALTAASVAALTIYDMAKGVDRGMQVGRLRLLEKSGGRSGTWTAPGDGA